MKKVFIFLLLFLFSFRVTYSQCANCDILNPSISTSYNTFQANKTTCFTSVSTTINTDITFGQKGVLCIAPGATLTIGSNTINANSSHKFTINVYGTLNITSNVTLPSSLEINVYSGGRIASNGLILKG
jgi:hypothetical protein